MSISESTKMGREEEAEGKAEVREGNEKKWKEKERKLTFTTQAIFHEIYQVAVKKQFCKVEGNSFVYNQ